MASTDSPRYDVIYEIYAGVDGEPDRETFLITTRAAPTKDRRIVCRAIRERGRREWSMRDDAAGGSVDE